MTIPIELLTAADACRIAKGEITPAGIRAAANSGKLPVAMTTPSGVRLFNKSTITDFLADRALRRDRAARKGRRETK